MTDDCLKHWPFQFFLHSAFLLPLFTRGFKNKNGMITGWNWSFAPLLHTAIESSSWGVCMMLKGFLVFYWAVDKSRLCRCTESLTTFVERSENGSGLCLMVMLTRSGWRTWTQFSMITNFWHFPMESVLLFLLMWVSCCCNYFPWYITDIYDT